MMLSLISVKLSFQNNHKTLKLCFEFHRHLIRRERQLIAGSTLKRRLNLTKKMLWSKNFMKKLNQFERKPRRRMNRAKKIMIQIILL